VRDKAIFYPSFSSFLIDIRISVQIKREQIGFNLIIEDPVKNPLLRHSRAGWKPKRTVLITNRISGGLLPGKLQSGDVDL